VVLGELHRDAIAHQVRPRVAAVREHDVGADDHRTDQRRAHAALAAIGFGLGDDRFVRCGHALLERLQQVLASGGRPLQEPRVRRHRGDVALPVLANRGDRDRARDLTGRMATHAIAHDEDAGIWVDEVRVLVVLAHLANARLGGSDDRRASCHAIQNTRPKRVTRPYPRIL
jgi:hypothetical protein